MRLTWFLYWVGLAMFAIGILIGQAHAYTCEDVRHFVATHSAAEVAAVRKTLTFGERHAAAACLPYGNHAGVASASKD